jgi:hypothetical protein
VAQKFTIVGVSLSAMNFSSSPIFHLAMGCDFVSSFHEIKKTNAKSRHLT